MLLGIYLLLNERAIDTIERGSFPLPSKQRERSILRGPNPAPIERETERRVSIIRGRGPSREHLICTIL